MAAFVVRRLAQSILVIWGALTIIFIVVRVVPGDPAALMLGTQATPHDVAVLRQQLGLDQPLPLQYGQYLSDVAQLNFGASWRQGGDSLLDCLARLPATLLLALVALILTLLLGFPLGVVAARRAGGAVDHLISTVSLAGQALPTFWVGIMLVLLFARGLNVLPSSGAGSPQALLLPAFTLALPFIGWLARLVRSGVLEEMNQEYVRTARAKGLSERVVFWVHVLRNTLIPVVTVLGLLIGNFIGGAVIVEIVFAWPGIGRLMIDSITYRDYSVVEASVTLITVFYVVLNLAVDVLYFRIDPRIRVENA